MTRFTYDRLGNVTVTQDPENGSTRASYEPAFNQPVSLADPRNNSTLLEYDAKGNLLKVTAPLNHVTVNSYDAFGHVATTRDPTNKTTQFTYDPTNGALQTITDPLTRVTDLQTDPLSRVTLSRDPADKVTRYEYDPAGNLTKVTDHVGGLTQYVYEPGRPRKRLTQVIDAKNHATIFGYDANGRLVSTKNALNQTRTSAYDDKGNLVKTVNARGQPITYEYDGSDRLTQKVTPEGTFNYAYDAAGNLTRVSNPAGAVEMSYDGLNRVTRVIQTIGTAPPATIDYVYDANGNRIRMSTPYGTFSYVYDALNRLTELKNPQNRVFTFEYDAAGRRTKLVYPNGIETRYVYDDAGQVTSIRHVRVSDNVVIAKAEYAYDAAGNRTQMTDLDGVHTYGYDHLHRLVEAVHPSTNTPVQHETFSYDAVGNRLADAKITGYTYDDANRLVSNSSFSYVYDADGNLTRKRDRFTEEVTLYSYDSENRLVGVNLPSGQNWTYKYDAYGRRVEKSSGTAPSSIHRFVYDGENIIAATDGQANSRITITHGAGVDFPMSTYTSNNEESYIHSDGLKSVIAISDENGAANIFFRYSVFGLRNVSGLPSNTFFFGFTGRELDYESGQYHYRNRNYDPLRGQFTSEDPLGLKGSRTNLYAYTENNPTNLTDAYGLVSGDPGEDLLWADSIDFENAMENFSNFSAGFGDSIYFGSTGYLRDYYGIGGINQCSNSYRMGGYAVGLVGTGRIGYALAAKAGSILAPSGAAASAFRESLKNFFRLGLGKSWRPARLSKYSTDAALRSGAGRTNPYMNATGGLFAGSGFAHGCGCP